MKQLSRTVTALAIALLLVIGAVPHTGSAAVHSLFITYQTIDAPDSFLVLSETIDEGKDFYIISPYVEGYAPDLAVVEGTMQQSSIFIDVWYIRGDAPTHWLTINYVYGDNEQAAGQVRREYHQGEDYSIESPSIQDCVADKQTVSGRMGLDDVTVTVTYTARCSISVSASPSNGGSVYGGGVYDKGGGATLTASPAEGWRFTGWTENGNTVCGEPEYTFTVMSDRDLTACFEEMIYRVEFYNGDSLLGGGEYSYGETAQYIGKTPVKPDDDHYYYVFSGWDPALGPLSGQEGTRVYRAQFAQYDRYVLTAGAGGKYVRGSGVPLEFIFRPAAGDDPTAIGHFTCASVDGKDLAEGTDLTVKAGSVVVDILPGYLDSLSAGGHTLTAVFDGSFRVDVDFEVVVPPPSNPKTGLSSNMGLYGGILLLACLAAGAVFLIRRKKGK